MLAFPFETEIISLLLLSHVKFDPKTPFDARSKSSVVFVGMSAFFKSISTIPLSLNAETVRSSI